MSELTQGLDLVLGTRMIDVRVELIVSVIVKTLQVDDKVDTG